VVAQSRKDKVDHAVCVMEISHTDGMDITKDGPRNKSGREIKNQNQNRKRRGNNMARAKRWFLYNGFEEAHGGLVASMEPSEFGEYVLYTDYAAAEQRTKELEAERDSYKEWYAKSQDYSTGLEQQLADLERERDELNTEKCNIAAERNKLRELYDELKVECDQLAMQHSAALDKVAELQDRLIETGAAIRESLEKPKSRSAQKRQSLMQGKDIPQFPAQPDASCTGCVHHSAIWGKSCRECTRRYRDLPDLYEKEP
jgi:DNA repair exonuclease SbcCD ATPase subunit